MSRPGRSVVLFIAGLLLSAALTYSQVANDASPNTPPVHHKAHSLKKATPPLVLPPLPPGPLQQVPMDKIPAIAPQVTYENGQLKIVADNATLGSILKDVRQLTGASIDLPPNGAPERVVTNIGPGAPRDVLALLLNGTQFNYVMLGSSSDPGAVSSVVLSPKPSSGETQTVADAAYQPGPQNSNPMMAQPFRQQLLANQQQAVAQADDSTDDADADDKSNDADQNQQVQSPPADSNANSGDQANQPNNGPKTPEQMLEMMRQRLPGMSQQPGQPGPLTPPNPSPPDQ